MRARPFLSHILQNDALTRGLGDAEARILIEWLVERTEQLVRGSGSETAVWQEVRQLCRRARAIAHFVVLWCYNRAYGAAVQFAGAERFTWPLPVAAVDPGELMASIIHWESVQARAA